MTPLTGADFTLMIDQPHEQVWTCDAGPANYAIRTEGGDFTVGWKNENNRVTKLPGQFRTFALALEAVNLDYARRLN